MSVFNYPLFSQDWDRWVEARLQTGQLEKQTKLLGEQTRSLATIAKSASTPVEYSASPIYYPEAYSLDNLADEMGRYRDDILDSLGLQTEQLTGIRNELDDIHQTLFSGLRRIKDVLVRGFDQLADQLLITNQTLAEIRAILQRPATVRANERKDRGLNAYMNALECSGEERKQWLTDSVEELKTALADNKFDPQTWFALGMIDAYELRDYPKAITNFSNALRYAKPVDKTLAALSARHLSSLKLRLKDYEGALKAADEALELFPDESVLMYEKARACYAARRDAMGEYLLKEAIASNPQLWAICFADKFLSARDIALRVLREILREYQSTVWNTLSQLRARACFEWTGDWATTFGVRTSNIYKQGRSREFTYWSPAVESWIESTDYRSLREFRLALESITADSDANLAWDQWHNTFSQDQWKDTPIGKAMLEYPKGWAKGTVSDALRNLEERAKKLGFTGWLSEVVEFVNSSDYGALLKFRSAITEILATEKDTAIWDQWHNTFSQDQWKDTPIGKAMLEYPRHWAKILVSKKIIAYNSSSVSEGFKKHLQGKDGPLQKILTDMLNMDYTTLCKIALQLPTAISVHSIEQSLTALDIDWLCDATEETGGYLKTWVQWHVYHMLPTQQILDNTVSGTDPWQRIWERICTWIHDLMWGPTPKPPYMRVWDREKVPIPFKIMCAYEKKPYELREQLIGLFRKLICAAKLKSRDQEFRQLCYSWQAKKWNGAEWITPRLPYSLDEVLYQCLHDQLMLGEPLRRKGVLAYCVNAIFDIVYSKIASDLTGSIAPSN